MMSPGWIHRCLPLLSACLLSPALLFTGAQSASGATTSSGSTVTLNPDNAVVIHVVGPTRAGMAGTYLALIEGETYEERGFFRLTLNAQGRGTAVVQLGKQPAQNFRISGAQFAVGGTASPAGEARLSARLKTAELSGKVVRSAATGRTSFEGTMTYDGRSIPLNARATLRTSDAAQAGNYTLAFTNSAEGTPLPSGTAGIGVAKVSKNGKLRFLGLLADGQTFTQGSQLLEDGTWLLSAKARRGNAQLAGSVIFADQPGSDLQSDVLWTRPEQVKGERVVQTSASTELILTGSEYMRTQGLTPQSGQPTGWLLDVKATDHSIGFHVAFRANGQLRTTSIDGGIASVGFVKPAGVVRGSYVRNRRERPRSLIGVLFQKTGEVFGLVGLNGRGGSFSMNPSSEAEGGGTSAGSVKVGGGTLVISNPGANTGGATIDPGTVPIGGSGSTTGGSIQLGGSNGSTAGGSGSLNGGNHTVTGGSINFGGPTTPILTTSNNTGVNGSALHITAGATFPITGTTLPPASTFTFGTAPDTTTYTSAEILAVIEEARDSGVTEINISGARLLLL